MEIAIEEALKSKSEGGIPIGSVLVRNGEVISRGHNKRVQENNPILHAEMDCLNNAGRISTYKDCVLYSTLMPCYMCGGTAVQFNILEIVVGENTTFHGSIEFLLGQGIKVTNLQLQECIDMMNTFISENPELWFEDIGSL